VRLGLPLLVSDCGLLVEQRLRAVCAGCSRKERTVLCAQCRDSSGLAWPPGLIHQPGYGALNDVWSCGIYRQRLSGFAQPRGARPASGRALSPLASALHRFKYSGDRYTGRRLARLTAHLARLSALRGDIVIPLPMHPRRLRERGFNQSGLLAASMARTLGLPLAPGHLRRVRADHSQRGLGGKARRRNVTQTFASQRFSGPKRRVLLVDDVMTTGATATDAARALREAGASSVDLVVLLLSEA
jgi:ComF family protein